MQDLYDSARWYLYTWLGDRDYNDHYTAEFELRYNSFYSTNDSIELFFHLYMPEGMVQPGSKAKRVSRCSMAFNFKTKKKLWGWDINGFSSALNPGDTRFDNARSEEVVRFIKTQRQKLNPCFLELAKKMKIFVE